MATILVVDDEAEILDLLAEELTEFGFDVISANNGATALVLVYSEKPDVVLLDLMLPIVNGYSVLSEIRENPSTKNLPVIILTAVASKDVAQEVIRLGANNYMTKPWKLGEMLDVIWEALGIKPKAVQEL